MIRVYCAGPYTGKDGIETLKNIGKGQQYCAKLFAMGLSPFCPWHDRTFVMDNPYESFTVEQFREHSMAWLEVSDCVFVLPGWENSTGALAEIYRARSLDIPVFFDEIALLEWARWQK